MTLRKTLAGRFSENEDRHSPCWQQHFFFNNQQELLTMLIICAIQASFRSPNGCLSS